MKNLRRLLHRQRGGDTVAPASVDLHLETTTAVILAASMSAAGVVWGTIYALLGEPLAASVPYGYAGLTLLNVLIFRLTNRDPLFRSTQVLLTLFLPFLLMLALGGFNNSGAVILWSLVAPVGALVLLGERSAGRWFAAYVALILLGGVLEPWGRRSNALPPAAIIIFFVMNVTAVSALVFVILRYFFVQKNAAVRAYIQQELALRQSERLATLGKLSAGVAHELNNPAAAARRGAAQLEQALANLQPAQRALGALALSDGQKEEFARLEELARERARLVDGIDPLALADREDEVGRWLEESDIECRPECATTLAQMGYGAAELAQLSGHFPLAARAPLLSWLDSTYTIHALLNEIGHSTTHISEVVNALKAYSFMDQMPVQLVDVRDGLETTLVILRSRLRDGITVHRDYAPDVPRIQAYGSELNDVWTNIIDNAIQALDGTGEITLRTRAEGGWVHVEIEDNGPGIPESIQPRIFDPFFTTKAPGQGTGLGLNISHGIIVQKHRGRLAVSSKPGQTRFTASLPIDLAPPP